ncbi:PAAR-like protein [Oceanivirga salmonicida]|uniref:PAAR-like protein n=1 Tax=Oceanivirga salmonicida TaxID=1769291 RepID=UPI00082B3506|nr:PAAR-like protein [Oceanivirga salmonicida]
MQLKYFEEKLIPNEVHRFYDDLAEVYLKSTYEYGKEEKGEIIKPKIGRYLMSKVDISLVEANTDLGFLVYSKEGFSKQDEIVLNYDKYIVLPELSEIIEMYLDEIFDVSYIKHSNGKLEITKKMMGDKYRNSVKVSIAGLIIAVHKFDIRKVKKVFDREMIYCDENNIPITYYMASPDYDLSFISSEFENIVFPKANEEEEKSLDKKSDFIGQNGEDIVEQLKKEIMQEQKNKSERNSKILDNLSKILEFILNNDKVKEKKDEIISNIRDSLVPKNSKKKSSYVIPKNKSNISKIKEKFRKDYGEKKFSEYFEDTTNREVKKQDKKVLNEILKSNPDEVIEQKKFDNFKKITKSEIGVIDYLYELCSKSDNPLERLEKYLKFLSLKNSQSSVMYFYDIAKTVFKSKVKDYITSGINNLAGVNLENIKDEYLLKLGLADVDDIKFDIKHRNIKEYTKTVEYKFLMIFKNQNLVKESFSGNYPKSRRLLNNLQIAMIKSMVNIKYREFDGYKNKEWNILNRYIIYLDEYLEGLSMEEYTWFYNLTKEVDITIVFIALIKSDFSFRDDSISKISEFMYWLNYNSYSDKKNMGVDKSVLLNVFPNLNSLEYNMKLRKAYNIAKFYKSLYESKISNETTYFVCDKAKIACSFSSDISVLNVLKSSKLIENKNAANIKDKNIVPFKMCVGNKPCVPNLSDWERKNDILIGSNYSLMNDAKCFCKVGGVISIIDPNQKKHSIKNIDKRDNKKIYEVNDYIDIYSIVEDIEKVFFNRESRMLYSTNYGLSFLEKSCITYFRNTLKAKIDEKNLESDTCIPAVDSKKKAIVNAYALVKKIKEYYENKLNENYSRYIKSSIASLEVVYSPYNLNSKKLGAYWMPKVFREYRFNKDGRNLYKSIIKYHREGGGINANKNTPWCASFANYIMNNGLKSPSSQCYYTSLGKKYYKKIKDARYGAILVLYYGNGKGHCTFILSETSNGYYCMGGNQGGVIKRSFYVKNEKIQGIYWPI